MYLVRYKYSLQHNFNNKVPSINGICNCIKAYTGDIRTYTQLTSVLIFIPKINLCHSCFTTC